MECGVSEVTPFESSRCIVRAKPEAEARKTERRQRIAEEAAKQCGRGIIPPVYPTVTYAAALESASTADLVLFCYEGSAVSPLPAILQEATPKLREITQCGRIPEIAIFVGSEGGFSPEEAAAAQAAGCHLTGLGRRILRCETAPLVALSCVGFCYDFA